MSDLDADDRLDEVLRALAERVRTLRHGRQLTVSDLAFEAGLSEGRIRAVEAGRSTASLPTLVALAETFEIPLADLFRDATTDAPDATEADGNHVETPSPYVVPSAVVWGGDLPPAPWAVTEAAVPEPGPLPDVPAVPDAPRTFAPTEKVWGGPLPPAPWMPPTPPPHDEADEPPSPRAAGTAPAARPELPPGFDEAALPRTTPHAPAVSPSPTTAVARAHDYAIAHGMRKSSAYVFVSPDAAPKPVPRTFSDLRTGPLAGRNFRSLQEFAVASIVEGGYALADVARVFRIPVWRLEQWVNETGHVPR